MTKECKGSPPPHAVTWTIHTYDGRVLRGFGQTAFVAAMSVGVLLSEVRDMDRVCDGD